MSHWCRAFSPTSPQSRHASRRSSRKCSHGSDRRALGGACNHHQRPIQSSWVFRKPCIDAPLPCSAKRYSRMLKTCTALQAVSRFQMSVMYVVSENNVCPTSLPACLLKPHSYHARRSRCMTCTMRISSTMTRTIFLAYCSTPENIPCMMCTRFLTISGFASTLRRLRFPMDTPWHFGMSYGCLKIHPLCYWTRPIASRLARSTRVNWDAVLRTFSSFLVVATH